MKIVTLFILLFSSTIFGQEQKFPKFNWDKVPVAFHFAKRRGLLTKAESEFVTSKSNFIVLEKGHGSPNIKYTEDAIAIEAENLKKLNPNMKVVFYWNSFLDYNMYKAHEVYNEHPEWWLKKKNGELDFKNRGLKRYDLSNPNVRNWWTDVAKTNLSNKYVDGVFMDAFIQVVSPLNKNLWGDVKYNAIQSGLKKLIKETREKIGDDKLIIYNGIRSTPKLNVGNGFPDYTDVVMIEHFGNFESTSKESMLLDIQEMESAGKSGKIVVFKAWPSFSWIDKKAMSKSYSEKQEIAKNNITFPLAAFLAGAQKNSYFIYNWGYRMELGCLEWYPELDKPLGNPLNDMQIVSWELSREYEHASVHVNLETKEAIINWKN
tara:strand:+ start:2231 stop:3358 length:1128 start_codon:yes stop_codon:yes gene_type:complete